MVHRRLPLPFNGHLRYFRRLYLLFKVKDRKRSSSRSGIVRLGQVSGFFPLQRPTCGAGTTGVEWDCTLPSERLLINPRTGRTQYTMPAQSSSCKSHAEARKDVERPQWDHAAYVSNYVFLLLLSFRIVNALSIKTFFQPDEYFQSLEPAWEIAFGTRSGAWITWACKHP